MLLIIMKVVCLGMVQINLFFYAELQYFLFLKLLFYFNSVRGSACYQTVDFYYLTAMFFMVRVL